MDHAAHDSTPTLGTAVIVRTGANSATEAPAVISHVHSNEWVIVQPIADDHDVAAPIGPVLLLDEKPDWDTTAPVAWRQPPI